MKKEIADQWVAALRSGQYTQARGKLRMGGSHCCLGVLCELHAATGQGGEWKPGLGGAGAYMGLTASLPGAVEDWAGMQSDNGFLPGGPPLAARNDDGSNFIELADIIETNWEAL